MDAIVLRAFGESANLRLESVPEPTAGVGEVLLRVHACGVCYHDIINRRGHLPRTSVPAILGHEVAGEVIGWEWHGGSFGVSHSMILVGCGRLGWRRSEK